MTVTTKSQIQIINYVGAGRNGFGVISAPGVKAGDFILAAWINVFGSVDPGTSVNDRFRPLIVTDDEIIQLGNGGDLTSADITVVVLRT